MAVHLTMLAAAYGDCLWLEHRTRKGVRRVIIDGGTAAAGRRLVARVASLPEARRHVDLFVVTHVDADHIGGALALVGRPPSGLTIGEVWFNGRRHLPVPRGARQGERLTTLLDELPARYPWNTRFAGAAVVTSGPGTWHTIELWPGATATLLSPTPGALAALAPAWDEAVRRARTGTPSDVEPQPVPRGRPRTVEELAVVVSRSDRTAPNGSSIAMILEIGGRSVLLGADAHPTVLVPALRALAASRGQDRVPVDAVKLPHHGSQANVTTELVELLASPRWLVSTNGDRFHHPDPQAMARVILSGGPNHTLCFNYRSPRTRRWDDAALMSRYGYRVAYPTRRGGGLTLEL